MRRGTVTGAGFFAALVLAVAVSRGSAQETAPAYVGDKSCMKCHFKQHKSWKKTPLAESMNALKPTPEAEKDRFAKKKKAGLDPAKDYSTDAKCLPCHTTGYGRQGGYPTEITADNDKVAKTMGAVSCEACHGPGSKYVEHKTAKTKEDKEAKFTAEGLKEFGLVLPKEETCRTCHNKDNPTNDLETFDFEKDKLKVHEHTK